MTKAGVFLGLEAWLLLPLQICSQKMDSLQQQTRSWRLPPVHVHASAGSSGRKQVMAAVGDYLLTQSGI